jgi:Mrp family chromosome partitioning ATPase
VNKKKVELDEKVDELRKYKAAEGLLNVDVASGNQLDLIKQFEKNLSDEKTNRNTLNASMESVDAQLALSKKGRPVYDNSNAEIIEIRKQIVDLNDKYAAKGSNDEAMKSKITSLRNELQTLLSNSRSSSTVSVEQLQQQKVNLTAQLNASDMNIKALENRIASLKGTVGSYATKEATVGSLKHEADMAQDEYNKLKEKLTAAQDNQTAASNNFKQTLKGQPSYKPESSKRLIIMGMAGVSVGFLSALIILLMEFLDHSLKSPSVFGRQIDLKLISSINHADLQKHSILEVLKHSSKNGKETHTRQNTFRELVRKLRYEVEHSHKQVLLLTSTESQQGKTTLAQALAYSLSLSNKKVLLSDTNFCNNDLTIQMQAEPTLESFSVAPEDLTIEKIKAIVTTYPLSGIEVIGCKGGDYTPSEILLPNNILQHLDFLKKHYDFIIMEGAPLNEYTDSKELVKYVDGVIAIFSSKVALTQSDKDSIEFLQGLNGKLIGAVLNNVQEEYLEI